MALSMTPTFSGACLSQGRTRKPCSPSVCPTQTRCSHVISPKSTNAASCRATKRITDSSSTSSTSSAPATPCSLISCTPTGPSSSACSSCWLVPGAILGAALACSLVVVRHMHKRKQQRRRLDADPVLINAKTDPRGYQRALARTRQAAYVNKAVSFLKSGDPARAHMELTRALVENGTCRSPLLDGVHRREEVSALYRLHLENSEVPPNFSVLLQLQELLGLPQEEAEKIEAEVMQSPGSFSI